MSAISVSVGSALAAIYGDFSWFLYLAALIGTIFMHAATNLINDYYDVKSGVDTPEVATAQYRPHPLVEGKLEAGQVRWQNRYGNLTAVRYPRREGLAEQVTSHVTESFDPAGVGLFFQPVRAQGLRAGREGTDFGQLFLGLSMFLIAGAVILTGLLFVFGVESRSEQVGMLLAVGWPAGRVKRLLLAEGGLVAVLGTVLGIGAGLLYTRLMIYGLSTLWTDAVSHAKIHFHADSSTLLIGGLGGLLSALLAIWFTLRGHMTRPARQLMAGHLEGAPRSRASWSRGKLGLAVALVAFGGVVVFLVLMGGGDSQRMAGAFFGAGTGLGGGSKKK